MTQRNEKVEFPSAILCALCGETSAMNINEVSGQVVDAAMSVHTALGPGLLESAYEACLLHELGKRGVKVLSQTVLPVVYDGVRRGEKGDRLLFVESST